MKRSSALFASTFALIGLAGAPGAQAGDPPASRAIRMGEERVRVVLPATGLTEENADRIKVALEDMRDELYRCTGCLGEYARPGDCPKCGRPLSAHRELVLEQVVPDPEAAEILVVTREGMELRLSEVRRALRDDSVHVDEPQLPVRGPATLVFTTGGGNTSDEEAAFLERIVAEAGLFLSQRALATADEIRLEVVARESPVTLEKVHEAVFRVHPAFRVIDVIWNDWTPEA